MLQQLPFEPQEKIYDRCSSIERKQCNQCSGDKIDKIMVAQIDRRKNKSAADNKNYPAGFRLKFESEHDGDQGDLRMSAREYISRNGLGSLCACHACSDILGKIDEPP